MKPTSITKKSARSETDDAPKLTKTQLSRAEYRVAGKSVNKPTWQAAARAQLAKKRISIMLDQSIIEHFKSAAGARGYQTLINDTLRRAIDGEVLITEVRHMIQQELAVYKRR